MITWIWNIFSNSYSSSWKCTFPGHWKYNLWSTDLTVDFHFEFLSFRVFRWIFRSKWFVECMDDHNPQPFCWERGGFRSEQGWSQLVSLRAGTEWLQPFGRSSWFPMWHGQSGQCRIPNATAIMPVDYWPGRDVIYCWTQYVTLFGRASGKVVEWVRFLNIARYLLEKCVPMPSCVGDTLPFSQPVIHPPTCSTIPLSGLGGVHLPELGVVLVTHVSDKIRQRRTIIVNIPASVEIF